MPNDPQPPQQVRLTVQLPPEHEAGAYADFANVWRNGSSFVIDFMSVKQPAHPVPGEQDGMPPLLEAKVVGRIRIPSEQIFPLASALTTQGNKWLEDNGRSEPPESWFKPQDDPA